MTRKEALNHPYCQMLRSVIATTHDKARKAMALKQLEWKVQLLMGEITQEDYNNKLWGSMASNKGFCQAAMTPSLWEDFNKFLGNM